MNAKFDPSVVHIEDSSQDQVKSQQSSLFESTSKDYKNMDKTAKLEEKSIDMLSDIKQEKLKIDELSK